MNAFSKYTRGVMWLAGTYMVLQSPNARGLLNELFRGVQRNTESLYGRSDVIRSN